MINVSDWDGLCCGVYLTNLQAGIEVLLHDKNAYGESLQLYKELFTKQTKQVRFGWTFCDGVLSPYIGPVSTISFAIRISVVYSSK